MSDRVVFEGYVGRVSEAVFPWADEVISDAASAEEIDAAAKRWAWHCPLKLFTPNAEDPRFLRFVRALDDLCAMGPGEYRVFTSGFVEVDLGISR